MFSIVIPCYGKAGYLPETLDSVLAQTCDCWECLIVDDGSPDETASIAKNYIDRDTRFRYLFQSNAGVSQARNFGIRNARYHFILTLDADDKIHPSYLEKAQQVFNSQPNIDIVYSDKAYFDGKIGVRQLPDFSIEAMLYENVVNIASVFRKEVWEKTGGYSPDFKHGAEDRDFWLSAVECGFTFYKIPEVLFYYRVLPQSRDKVYKGDLAKRTVTHNLLVKRHIDLYQDTLGPALQAYHQAVQYRKALNSIHRHWWFKWQFGLWKRMKNNLPHYD